MISLQVNVFLSLENCEKSLERENHNARITKIRTEALAYIKETEWTINK